MSEFDKSLAAVYTGALLFFLFIVISVWSSMTNTKECRMAGIAAKLPTADIIVLCKM